MQVWHQKPYLSSDLPLSIFAADITEYPPHWHEAIEVVYALEDNLQIGVSNEMFTLNSKDILVISCGDIHYFPPQQSQVNRLILFIETAFFEGFTSIMKDKKFTKLLRSDSDNFSTQNECSLHSSLEKQILDIVHEYEQKKEGYKIALKARVSDILVLLIRYIPQETYSHFEKNRQLNRLERLEQVFNYVENNYEKNINLNEIASIANYSVYHFTRFFKEATGMTFIQYINNFRIAKASEYLIRSDESVIEVAFKSGFSSVKTFNRVFKLSKGCSPSIYRKAIFEN